jgi:hypothetical protein
MLDAIFFKDSYEICTYFVFIKLIIYNKVNPIFSFEQISHILATIKSEILFL